MDTILYEVAADGVATLVLNQPERRNPLDDRCIEELVETLGRFRRDDAARCLLVTGAGSAFCSGGDLGMLESWLVADAGPAAPDGSPGPRRCDPIAQRDRYRDGIQRVPRAFLAVEKPIVAAINGAAIGAGNDLALMCDIRVAGESARFGESFCKMGLAPGDGGAWLLVRAVGLEKACEMIFTGDVIDAREAHRIGLVGRVVPDAELMPTARALAAKIAAGPALALRMAKFAIHRGLNQTLDESLETMALMQAMLHGTADHREALRAFRERRPPEFRGR